MTTKNASRRARAPRKASPPATPPQSPAGPLEEPQFYINRELSWLEFNQRVLEQAHDPRHPLLERVKFLAIAATNLDEFHMVRVATILRKIKGNNATPTPDGLSPQAQYDAIQSRVVRMMQDFCSTWDTLRLELASQEVSFMELEEFTPEIQGRLRQIFLKDILPVLTPLAFDPGHPFPHISNLSFNFAVVVNFNGQSRFARVKIPDTLPRFFQIPEEMSGRPGMTFAFLEDVIESNLQELFPGTQIEEAFVFHVTRDTDLVIQEDEADDLLETVDQGLKQIRYGNVSRLHVEAKMPPKILDVLAENFEVHDPLIVRTENRLNFSDWMELLRLPLPALKDPPFAAPVLFDAQQLDTLFERIRFQDLLTHQPYESFVPVEAFIYAASRDPNVVAIKMTLYRVGANSPLVERLIEAAEAGKQVAVLVELKARFDERNNIAWARRLEAVGVHVVYGVLNLKTHCKLCLAVRQEHDGVRRYMHIGTGNYNPSTARIYTDLGLFTANEEIAQDVSHVFNYLTGYSNKREFNHLLVAPVNLRSGLESLIQREAEHARSGKPARLTFKVNSIADPRIIRVLYEASQAGVQIDLIVRGVCCLRPGVPEISENIRVHSIVGRFLEHSRIYSFENAGSPEVYIGSADLMERNLDRRVEVLTPVLAPSLRDHLREVVLKACLEDTECTFILQRDGSYRRLTPEEVPASSCVHTHLLEWYARRERERIPE